MESIVALITVGLALFAFGLLMSKEEKKQEKRRKELLSAIKEIADAITNK